MKKISIVLPVYNEAEVISKFADALYEVIDKLSNYQFEVIFCVEKSSDGTAEIVKEICINRKESIYHGMARRFGHQNMLIAGMDRSSGDAVIMMDCDLEHPPSLIPTLLEKFEEGYDVVHTKRKYNDNVSLLRRMPSDIYYKIFSFLSSVRLEEGSADFRLASRRCVDVFKNSIREQHQFLRGLFQWVGFEQCTVDFVSGERGGGQSKYTFKKRILFAINGIVAFSKFPLTILTTIGCLVAAVSFIYGIYSLAAALFSDEIVLGWPSTISLIAFLGGLQLVALGVIGRYIGEIVDEVKGRPLYIIQEEYQAEQNCDKRMNIN